MKTAFYYDILSTNLTNEKSNVPLRFSETRSSSFLHCPKDFEMSGSSWIRSIYQFLSKQ